MGFFFPELSCESDHGIALVNPGVKPALEPEHLKNDKELVETSAVEQALELTAEEIAQQMQRIEKQHQRVLNSLERLSVFSSVRVFGSELEMGSVDQRDEGLSESERALLVHMTQLTLYTRELTKCQN